MYRNGQRFKVAKSPQQIRWAGHYELMAVTAPIRALVHCGAEVVEIREQPCKDGVKALRVFGAMKIVAGLTTADEVIKVAPMA